MRDYTKFFTYPETARFMAKLLSPKDGEYILEPSAGNGGLIKAVHEISYGANTVAIEINPKHLVELSRCSTIVHIDDFLEIDFPFDFFHRCIANPPFGNGVDLQSHFDKIRHLVKQGGKVVMIVPNDFEPNNKHTTHPLENWSTNKDGTKTEIKIIEFYN